MKLSLAAKFLPVALALITGCIGVSVTAAPTASTVAPAAGDAPAAKDTAAFAARLRAAHPSTVIANIRPSPMPGLYEVVIGKNVAYVGADANLFLFGHIWDMTAQKDLTQDRRDFLDRVDLAVLPKELAIRSVNGNGRRVLYVLADPQCGYCKQLETTVSKMPDITVYTFLLPILGDDSRRLAEDIWCSNNRAAAWRDWMTKGVQPRSSGSACEAPVTAIESIAKSLGINSTPRLIAGDGRKQVGALGEAELTAWLDAKPSDPVGASVTK